MNGGECYLYDPEICEGDFCPGNCETCYKADLIFEKEEAADNDKNQRSDQ